MSKKLFVGGLAWATDDDGLRAAFEPFGQIVESKVMLDRDTGRSRGFGFITFKEESAASAAAEAMDGKTLDGRALRVNLADESRRQSSDRPRKPFVKHPSTEIRAQKRDDNPHPQKLGLDAPDFGYVDEGSGQRRGNRKKDKRRRNRFEEDDRW